MARKEECGRVNRERFGYCSPAVSLCSSGACSALQANPSTSPVRRAATLHQVRCILISLVERCCYCHMHAPFAHILPLCRLSVVLFFFSMLLEVMYAGALFLWTASEHTAFILRNCRTPVCSSLRSLFALSHALFPDSPVFIPTMLPAR